MLANHTEFLLRSLGYEDLKSNFDSSHLASIARQINPTHLDRVEKSIRNFRRWEDLGSSFIIGRVYGIDYITEIANERIAFTLTPYPSAVDTKITAARGLIKLWKSLGVSKFVVLLSIYPDSDKDVMFYDKDSSQDSLLSAISNVIESNEEVVSTEIYIQPD
jgi:hypothetical protein